ncbi:carbonic anhydrase [Planktothrix rubescens]|uniref:carbonic anhydrase n=1 Tax=Planktothrix rubescens TaxID=59512 RepID=UPI0003F6BE5A|nr:carbonic anhydrase [Planktothrix rubescens]
MNKTQQNLTISRRNLLKFGAGVAGTAVLTVGLGTKVSLFKAQPAVAQNGITPDEALNQLLEGNKRFIENKPEHPHQNQERMKEVAAGQKPFAGILGCSDSRVSAEIIFDQGLGDIFVVRNAGNVVTPEEIGSLEFGALELGIKTIMILGHEKCGAVKATLDGNAVPGQIGSIIDAIKPAIKGKPTWEEAVIANVKLQLKHLNSSPVISQLIKEGKLKIVGGYYNLETGIVKLVA